MKGAGKSIALERTMDIVCLIASLILLYLLPHKISILFYLLFGISGFLFCIGFFRLIATIDEPSLPETAYLIGLSFMVGGMAVNACGIYGVYSGQGSGRSIMIATLTLIEALVFYSMAGGLIKSSAVKRIVMITYRAAAVLLIVLGAGFMVKEQFSERTVILGTMLLIESVCLWKIKFEKAQFKEGAPG